MNGQTYRQWMRLVVGGLGALVLGAVFAPGQARAACGEGVMPLHATSLDTRPPGPTHNRPQPTPAPCSGPFCSRIPHSPPAVPASLPFQQVDDTGVLTSPPPFASPHLLNRLSDDLPSRPVRRTADVYHPPR
jgi:hypothetical protein